jgi:hypothetical protein
MLKTTIHYGWRVPFNTEDPKSHLIFPHSDSDEYEYPFDMMADTPEAAQQLLRDYGAVEDAIVEQWILCKITVEPLLRLDVVDPK